MELLEIILFIIVFIWLVSLSYSKDKLSEWVARVACVVDDLLNRTNEIEQVKMSGKKSLIDNL